jgi:thiol:disulfide interchange protein DsbD
MIKKLFLSVVALVLGCVAYAQVENPVQWSAKVENLGENLYEIVLTGTIEGEEWHIYDLGPYTDGPIATSLVVAGEGVKAVGSPYLKTEVHRAYDELFGMEIGTCATGVQIGQKVEVSGSAPVAKVTVEWQTCSEGSCLPPTDDVLTVKLPAGTGAAASADEVAPVKKEGGKSIWAVILEAIAWGFVALLTPCVFPMVPMTVSFFLKSKDGKGKFYASMYGFFIVALYTLPIAVIILLTYILGGDAVTADIFNWLATHWIPNILFFIIFMVFAASFFGAFEITMPSWMVNKTD